MLIKYKSSSPRTSTESWRILNLCSFILKYLNTIFKQNNQCKKLGVHKLLEGVRLFVYRLTPWASVRHPLDYYDVRVRSNAPSLHTQINIELRLRNLPLTDSTHRLAVASVILVSTNV